MPGMIRILAFLAALLLCTTFASAQYWDNSLSVGYSHFFPERSGGLFFSKDGAYLDGDFAWRIPQVVVPTFVGLGVTASGYWDSENIDYPIYYRDRDRDFGNSDLDSDVEFVELEPRLAMKFWIPGAPGVFVRPRIGAGLLVSNYSVDQLAADLYGFEYIDTRNFTGAAFEVRPAVQLGFERGPFAIGGELSYMASWGGFGAMGDVLQELRAGIFFRFRF
jgi:hypothetical protein